MKKQRVVVTFATNLNQVIDPLLSDGWLIKMMISENISKGGSTSGYTETGRIIILLEK
jgi:hypothetical protein